MKILNLKNADDVTDDKIVSMIGDVVGETISPQDFYAIQESLVCVDHTVEARLFPALKFLNEIVK